VASTTEKNIDQASVPGIPVDLNNPQSLTNEWMGLPYAELSMLIVQLKVATLIHQAHHWISRGDSFYGDHLLFQRLYDGSQAHIDSLAEKTVGLGSERNVDLLLSTKQIARLIGDDYGMILSMPRSSELASKSLSVEKRVLSAIEYARESLKVQGLLTTGLDNLLADIADSREEYLYLLKQRVAAEY
jgi:DNA-binding ferritin-like protein